MGVVPRNARFALGFEVESKIGEVHRRVRIERFSDVREPTDAHLEFRFFAQLARERLDVRFVARLSSAGKIPKRFASTRIAARDEQDRAVAFEDSGR